MGIGTDHGDPAPLSGKLRKAQQHGHVRMSAADNDEMPCHVYPPDRQPTQADDNLFICYAIDYIVITFYLQSCP